MINEQFCNYEISKKLKDLGFNEECFASYNLIDKNFNLYDTYANWNISFNTLSSKYCSAPLWQQVIDWLREKQNIYINVEPITFDDEPTYVFEIINLKNGMLLNDINSSFEDPNEAHEQAILKAIDIIKSV